MIDHEVGGHERIGFRGISAHGCEGVAHGGDVDDAGDAGEILKKHAGGHERDFFGVFTSGTAMREGIDIGGLHLAAVFVAEQVLEQNAVGERQARDVGNAFFLQRGEAENAVVRSRHI